MTYSVVLCPFEGELQCSVVSICQTVSMGQMGWWVVIPWLYNTLYCTLQCTVYSVHCTALHFALHFALHISLHIALNTALHIALYILEIHFTVHNRGIVRSNCPNAMTVIFGWIHPSTQPLYHTVQCALNITLVSFTNTI